MYVHVSFEYFALSLLVYDNFLCKYLNYQSYIWIGEIIGKL